MLVTEFDTEAVAAPERFELWRELFRSAYPCGLMRSDDTEDFRAKLRILRLGEVSISAQTLSSRLEIVRNVRSMQRFDPEMYQLTCGMSGVGRITTDRHDADIRTGLMLLKDSSHPSNIDLRSTSRRWFFSVTVQVPRALMPLPDKPLRQLINTPIPGDRGIGAAFQRWVVNLHHRAHEFTPYDTHALAATTTDLLASTLGRCLDAEELLPPEARRSALRARVHDFIERRLSDPALTPQAIADAHHISLRHLYRLLAEEDTTPAALIRHSRLERCRDDLADPRHADLPTHAVAARWGLPDPARFSRLFRSAYGMPPRDFRHQTPTGGVDRQRRAASDATPDTTP